MPGWFLLLLMVHFDAYKFEFLKHNEMRLHYLIWKWEDLSGFPDVPYGWSSLVILLFKEPPPHFNTCTHMQSYIYTYIHDMSSGYISTSSNYLKICIIQNKHT